MHLKSLYIISMALSNFYRLNQIKWHTTINLKKVNRNKKLFRIYKKEILQQNNIDIKEFIVSRFQKLYKNL